MSLEVFNFLADSGGSVLAERPPVLGEETDEKGSVSSIKSGKQSDHSAGTPRRSNLVKDVTITKQGVGAGEDRAPLGFEPEGSASVTPPYTRWTESLHALLSDEDGIQLFKHYLIQENAENPLLFWLATQGFKKKQDQDPVRTDLAKLIYRRFIKKEGQQVVRLQTATRNHVAECIRTNHVDSRLFDRSQAEVEEYMRETSYPMFLKSDVYVQYVNNGGMSPKSSEGCSSNASSSHQVQARYLPTLPEDSELADLPQPASLSSDMFQSTYHRHHIERFQERLYPGLLGVQNPYHPGCAAIAPATSNNDSELQSLSSDAISDDTMSLTDSSVDGFPVRSRQQQKRRQKRNMKYNIRQNGKVMGHLPCPRATQPREIPPADPVEFAQILIAKLEKVLAEREAKEKLAAKLRKVEEDEKECEVAASPIRPPSGTQIFPVHDFVEDDPNSILEDHMSRVFKDSNRHTPRGFSPRSRSPDHHRSKLPPSMANVPQVSVHTKPMSSSHHRHHMSKSKELVMPQNVANVGHVEAPYLTYIEDSGRHKKRSSKKSDISSISKTTDSGIYDGPPSLPSDSENSMKRVADWIREGDERVDPHVQPSSSMHHRRTHKPHPEQYSTMPMPQLSKKPAAFGAQRTSAEWERTHTPTTSLPKHSSPHLPKQPFVQDPKMPIMQPPEPLTVLEEARRRIDMSSRQHQRMSKGSDPRKDKRTSMMGMASGQTRSPIPTSISDNQIYPGLTKPSSTGGKRPGSSSSSSKGRPTSSSGTLEKKVTPSTTIAYYLCNDPIPYRTNLPGSEITLRQFKALISKKGTYRYTFKMPSTEFESGVVHQIIVDDDAVLPLYQGKVVGKVEQIDDH